MVFEFTVHPAFNFLASFAEKLHVPIQGNKLILPPSLGNGYVKEIIIEPNLKLVIHHYTLQEKLYLKRRPPREKNDLISIVFNSHEIPSQPSSKQQKAIQFLKKNGAAIQIASSILGTESLFPASGEVYFAVVGIQRGLLASLLGAAGESALLKNVLGQNTTFFYHENMTPEVHRMLRQLVEINDHDPLRHLYYRVKTQELLYMLFSKLMRREADRQSPIHNSDLDRLYAIKATIIDDLGIPPRLDALASMTGMSETKMKQLFKQVFGETIYNYYQKARLEEAAFLLRQSGYSVSEAGYQLGFSNLSHFSRLFERYYGMTPKKYSLTG